MKCYGFPLERISLGPLFLGLHAEDIGFSYPSLRPSPYFLLLPTRGFNGYLFCRISRTRLIFVPLSIKATQLQSVSFSTDTISFKKAFYFSPPVPSVIGSSPLTFCIFLRLQPFLFWCPLTLLHEILFSHPVNLELDLNTPFFQKLALPTSLVPCRTVLLAFHPTKGNPKTFLGLCPLRSTGPDRFVRWTTTSPFLNEGPLSRGLLRHLFFL